VHITDSGFQPFQRLFRYVCSEQGVETTVITGLKADVNQNRNKKVSLPVAYRSGRFKVYSLNTTH